MTRISVSELKMNTGKYVTMAGEQDILITRNGKVVAKLGTAKVDKLDAFHHLMNLFPADGIEVDLDQVREERLSI